MFNIDCRTFLFKAPLLFIVLALVILVFVVVVVVDVVDVVVVAVADVAVVEVVGGWLLKFAACCACFFVKDGDVLLDNDFNICGGNPTCLQHILSTRQTLEGWKWCRPWCGWGGMENEMLYTLYIYICIYM